MENLFKRAVKIVLILLIFSGSAPAQHISIDHASSLAQQWAANQSTKTEIVSIICKTFDNDTVIYIVNFQDSWLMVSADMSLRPIIGFSFDSQYSESDEPEAIKSLLSFYADVASENRGNGIDFRADWELMQAGNFKSSSTSGEVDPLLPVNWHQCWPYNAYCPLDSESPDWCNGHTNTSCGPTAFAQILRYWKHPSRGSGSHSFFYDNYGTVSANFGATTYNWDNMPETLSSEASESEYKDIAQLMVHAAVSVDHSWSSGGTLRQYTSSAVKYFGYSPTCRVLYRDDFSSSGWHSVFRDDLNNGRPIMICANKAGSAEPWEHGTVYGHYYVCDGYYGQDYYHINWGWGGSSNGYFSLFSFGQYIFHNHALIGLEPNYSNKELILSDPYANDNNTVVLMHFDGELNNESALSDNPSQNGNISFEDNSTLGLGQCLHLDNSSQDNQSFLEIPDNDNLDLSGDWTIEMWFKANSFGNNWNEIPTLISKPGSKGNENANYSAWIIPESDYYKRALFCNFYPAQDIENNTGVIHTDLGFLEVGNWYHFSFIRNTSDKTMKLIIHDSNGDLKHYASDSYHAERASNPRVNSNPLYIGFGYYSKTYFNGYIDELRISNVAREFEITSTSLTLITPNGGEIWESGSLEAIRWNSENIDNLKIEYSINNGDSWEIISSSHSASQGSYFWEVPDVESDECLIKITDVTNENVFQKSNSTFTIEEKTDMIWQEINMTTGWNIISLNVEPDNKDLLAMVQPLIDNETLHKIIDEAGNITQHMPWGWVNNIGNMSNTEGYYVKVTSNITLSVYGSVVPCPFDIDLFAGWNIMGYPCQNPKDAMEALQVLIDEGKLDKVIDENGNILQHMPWGWVNNIGDLSPGEGYYIKLSENASITFEEPGLASASKSNKHRIIHKKQDNGDLKKMK